MDQNHQQKFQSCNQSIAAREEHLSCKFHSNFQELEVANSCPHRKGPPGANLIKKEVIVATIIKTGIAINILLKRIFA